MVRSLNCLVDKHGGRDPYFRINKRPLTAKGGNGPETHDPNRVVDDLHQRTHDYPSPLGDLNRIYPHAVEMGYAGSRSVLLGGFVLFFLALASFFGYIFLHFMFGEYATTFSLILGIIFLGPLFVFSLLVAWWVLRQALWRNSYAPIIFNRRTRQVHAIKPVELSALKFWQLRGNRQMISYPWDRVRVRSYVILAAGGGGATTKSSLFLLWDTPEAPHKLVDYVQLGSKGGWVDDPHYRQWEYVRRYMEEDGPVLPTDNTLNSNYNKRPNMFPPAIVEAAGGTPYTPEQIRELVNEYKATEETADTEAVGQV